MSLVEIYASKLENLLKELIPNHPNEAEFRKHVDRLLDDFCEEAKIIPLARAEYTLGTGRADAVFNRFIIEYKKPGTLSNQPNHRANISAIEQVKQYINNLAKIQRQDISRVAGVVFDGNYLIFIRYSANKFYSEGPIQVNRNSLERFFTWLQNLSSGIALTPENLNRDFSIEHLRTQNILRSLFNALHSGLSTSDGMVSKLFEQWRIFFSEAIDYSEAFGGRKLEPLKKWVRKAGIEIHDKEEAERFFFVLHTYFALLVKLLAWLAVSRHLLVNVGFPYFAELHSADSETLRRSLQDMESGGIFRAYRINNLLEGDFFAWYLYAWNDNMEKAIREILKRLSEYEPTTLSIIPEETRDLFKKLYHYLLPREIRHNLGEYYTPDWLAQRLLNQLDSEFFNKDSRKNEKRLHHKLLNTRFLDPACGSGTFLVLIIARMIELGRRLFVSERELLERILNNVVGFDLNPLAVLTSRVNYLLAITELLKYWQGDITIPVYLTDSVRIPTVGTKLFTENSYEFSTAVGKFRVPAVLCTKERFDRFCDVLEKSIQIGLESSAFIARLERILGLQPNEWNNLDISTCDELYTEMLNLHKQGLNGLWARLLKNNFAPLTVGEFDYIVGNPPWINWEHLPDEYRRDIKPIWERYGLFPHGGMDTILGKGKKDISMLMTYTVTDKLLKLGGRLGFVVTQSLFKTAGAGQGFRRFRIPRQDGQPIPLRVVYVDDMVDLNPFEGASNRTAVLILEKGKATRYPVSYTVWRKKRRGHRSRWGGFTYESTLNEVIQSTKRLNFKAEPVDPKDPTSPWLTARLRILKAIRKVLGKSDYEAHEGVNTGGANGVYWMEIVHRRPDGLVVVRNLTEGAKVKVREVTEPIEPDLLYPLLRGRDVQRWKVEPSALILMVQDPRTRRGINEKKLQTRYPRTYAYLKQFESILRERAAFKRYFTRKINNREIVETGPFYSMFDVGDYTFAPWKVVWTRLAQIEAAVVGTLKGKAVVPQETISLVQCKSEQEAHYLAALVNSAIFQFGAVSFSQEGGKSMGSMHVLDHIRIPRFDPKNKTHLRLAELSKEAHKLAKAGNEKRLREIEAEIDRVSARIWGLSEDELREIQKSLQELKGIELEGGEEE